MMFWFSSFYLLWHCEKLKTLSCVWLFVNMWDSMDGLYSPWNSLGQKTVVDSLSLLQGIFPTQGSNPGFLHFRWILYQLSHKESFGTVGTFNLRPVIFLKIWDLSLHYFYKCLPHLKTSVCLFLFFFPCDFYYLDTFVSILCAYWVLYFSSCFLIFSQWCILKI